MFRVRDGVTNIKSRENVLAIDCFFFFFLHYYYLYKKSRRKISEKHGWTVCAIKTTDVHYVYTLRIISVNDVVLI